MRKLHGDAGDRHVESAGKRRSRRAEARQNVGAWIQRAVAEVHSVDIGANKRRAKIVRRAHAKYRSDRSSRPDDVREQRLVRDYRYPAGFDIVGRREGLDAVDVVDVKSRIDDGAYRLVGDFTE